MEDLQVYQSVKGVFGFVLAIEEHGVIRAAGHGPVVAPGAGVGEVPQGHAVDYIGVF